MFVNYLFLELPADKPQTDKDTITQALKLSLEEESIRKQQERNDAEISRLQALIHETQILLQEKLNLQNKVRFLQVPKNANM